MTDQIKQWRALVDRSEACAEDDNPALLDAIRAACDRIEALEGETALLKGPHEERTPLDDPAWVVAVVEERDRLRARLAEVEGECAQLRAWSASADGDFRIPNDPEVR